MVSPRLRPFYNSLVEFDDELMEQEKVELPDLNLNTLAEYDDKLGNYLRIYSLRDVLVSYLQEHHVIEKLCELFETAEDMEMKEELVKIFSIMRSVSTSFGYRKFSPI